MARDWKEQKLAMERIERLFQLAEDVFGSRPERAHRDVEVARKIAMRYNIRIPPRLRARFCGKCYKYLKPNVNCKVSVRSGLVIVRCLECGSVNKMAFRRIAAAGRRPARQAIS